MPPATTGPPVGVTAFEALVTGSLKSLFQNRHTSPDAWEATELFIAEESPGIFHPNTEQTGPQS